MCGHGFPTPWVVNVMWLHGLLVLSFLAQKSIALKPFEPCLDCLLLRHDLWAFEPFEPWPVHSEPWGLEDAAAPAHTAAFNAQVHSFPMVSSWNGKKIWMADFESRWKGEIQANYQKWKVAYLEFISIFFWIFCMFLNMFLPCQCNCLTLWPLVLLPPCMRFCSQGRMEPTTCPLGDQILPRQRAQSSNGPSRPTLVSLHWISWLGSRSPVHWKSRCAAWLGCMFLTYW